MPLTRGYPGDSCIQTTRALPSPSAHRGSVTLSWVASGQMGGLAGRPGGQTCEEQPSCSSRAPSRTAPHTAPPAPAVSEFFRASCVPGSSPTHHPASLCALCVGDEQGRNRCAGNSQERYFGYSGAFRYSGGPGRGAAARGPGPPTDTGFGFSRGRCLAENAGDVAFVKHTTVFDNTNGT